MFSSRPKMTDIIRCEGLGAVSLLDLVDRLSSPNQTFNSDGQADGHNQEETKQTDNPPAQRKLSLKSKQSYTCPVDGCERTFCKEAALNNHVTRHNRVYKCDECGKCFSEQAKVGTKGVQLENYFRENN